MRRELLLNWFAWSSPSQALLDLRTFNGHSPNKNGKWLTKFPKDSDSAGF